MRVWDAESGRELLCLRHETDVRAAVFRDDGRCLVTLDRAGILRRYDALDWTMTREQVEEWKLKRYRKWIEANR